MRLRNETKSEFCERVMRSHGLVPGFRNIPASKRKRRSDEEISEERKALRADMERRVRERFAGQTRTGKK